MRQCPVHAQHPDLCETFGKLIAFWLNDRLADSDDMALQ